MSWEHDLVTTLMRPTPAQAERIQVNRARADALWGKGWTWPYGPNIDLESQERLLDWAEAKGLRRAKTTDDQCLHWLRTGRRCKDRSIPQGCDPRRELTGWYDHPTTWLAPSGRRLLVCHPYRAPLPSELPAGFPHVIDPDGGWYGLGTTYVEVSSP